MATVGEAWVDIKPSAKGFGRTLEGDISGELDASGKSAGAKFGNALKVGALAAVGGAVVVGKFLSGAIAEAREAQVIGARTENVIKSMGNAAKISATQVGQLATAISNKTGVDDEAIQAGQNLLLTFGNIKNEVGGEFVGTFNRASYLMTDIAAAMGTDAKGAALQLGKALNDPIAGMSSLSRVGVSFTAQQKEQIKTLQESGDTVGAQNVILGELQKQFGGAAAAMATPADRLKTVYGNLKEQIGTALIPIADKFINLLLSAAPSVSSALSQIGPVVGQLTAFFVPLVGTLRDALQPVLERVFEVLSQNKAILAAVGLGLVALVSPVAAIALGMAALYQQSETFRNVISQIGTFVTTTLVPALTAFGQYLAANLFPVFQQVAAIVRDQVVPILQTFGQFIATTLVPAVVDIAQSVAEKLQPAFDALVQFWNGTLLPAAQQLLAKFKEYQPTIQKVVEVVVKVAGKFAEFAASIISFVLPKLLALVSFFIQRVIPAVADVIGIVVKVIAKVVAFGAALVDGVKDAAEFAKGVIAKAREVLDYMGKLPDKIVNAIGDVADLLLDIGEDIIGGLKRGIEAGAQKVIDAVDGIIDKIPDFIKDKLGIASPSKVMADIAKWIPEGLAKGIADNAKAPVEAMQKVVDAIKGKVSELRDQFGSLKDSVASAFVPDLLTATTYEDYIGNAATSIGDLRGLREAFRKLQNWGISSQFLAQLFQSGNGALILDLAAGDKREASLAAFAFDETNRLADKLGAGVADDVYGAKLDKSNQKLDQVVKELQLVRAAVGRQGAEFGKALNGSVSDGRRKGRAA